MLLPARMSRHRISSRAFLPHHFKVSSSSLQSLPASHSSFWQLLWLSVTMKRNHLGLLWFLGMCEPLWAVSAGSWIHTAPQCSRGRHFSMSGIYCLPLSWARMGFPGGWVVKNPPTNAGDASLIPESGRAPGEENVYPLQYSCLGNRTDRGAWQATPRGRRVGLDRGTKQPLSWASLCPFYRTGSQASERLGGLKSALLEDCSQDWTRVSFFCATLLPHLRSHSKLHV